jgi:hypothetical protein
MMTSSRLNSDHRPPNAAGAASFTAFRLPLFFLFFILIIAFGNSGAGAQPDVDMDLAPPPLRTLSKIERSRLDAVADVKKRTQLALELMSVRLTQAEAAHSEERLDAMFEELGGFHGLMDNTLAFLDKSDQDRNRVLNNYKRFEIGIRQFRPRLELIRRDLPRRYETYVKNLIVYLRDARAKAVEPLFSNTVIPNTKP